MDKYEDFLKAERICDFNVSEARKKLWKAELDIFEEIIRICNKHNLKYFATGGTLLGAVRHEGFIPWDDDIDIAMHRDDYEKFIDVAKSDLNERFFLQTVGTDEGFFFAITKVRAKDTTAIIYEEWEERFPYNQGIFVDIFPIDAIPDSNRKMKIHKFFIKLLNSIARSSVVNLKLDKKYSLLHRISFRFFRICCFFIKPIKFAELRDKIVKKYNNQSTKNIGFISQLYGFENAIWPRSWYDETISVPFEYLTISVPKDYDRILTKTYGDWRTPMRVENIENNEFMHSGTFFDTEKSYEYYISNYEKYKNADRNL